MLAYQTILGVTAILVQVTLYGLAFYALYRLGRSMVQDLRGLFFDDWRE